MVGSDERHPADAIVLGEGVAAAAAAARMARAGLAVILVGRSRSPAGPGKSYSGVVDEQVLARAGIAPASAPFERGIVRQERWWISPHAVLRTGLQVGASRLHTVLSEPLVDSLVAVAETNGATKLSVGDAGRLITHRGRVLGVTTQSHGPLFGSTVVVAADYASARRLLEDVSGSQEHEPVAMATVEPAIVTERHVDLPDDSITERFGVPPGGGATIDCLGVLAGGIAGHAFLRTHRASVSIGAVVLLAELAARDASREVPGGVSAQRTLDAFLEHPALAPYVLGCTINAETSQVLVVSGKYADQYHGQGYLIAPSPRILDGSFTTQLLIGEAAGNTAIRCKERDDFSPKALSEYSMQVRRICEASAHSNAADLSAALHYDFHERDRPRRFAKAFLGSAWNGSPENVWSKLVSSVQLSVSRATARRW